MKRYIVTLLSLIFFLSPVGLQAEEKATVQEVYDLVVKAAGVVSELGEDSLDEFNKPNGTFVFKDTYAFVIDCETMTLVGHPMAKARGTSTKAHKCMKTGRFIMADCGEVDPVKGSWVEYWWSKPGSDEPHRKLGFYLPVKGTHYLVAAGIYDDNVSLEELNDAR